MDQHQLSFYDLVDTFSMTGIFFSDMSTAKDIVVGTLRFLLPTMLLHKTISIHFILNNKFGSGD